jgi:hypothetical protein
MKSVTSLLNNLALNPMTFGQMQFFVFKRSRNYESWKSQGLGDKAPQGYWCDAFNILTNKTKVIKKNKENNLYYLTPIGESIKKPMSVREARKFAYYWEEINKNNRKYIQTQFNRENDLRLVIKDFLDIDPMTLSPNDYRRFLNLIKQDLIHTGSGKDEKKYYD